MCIRDSQKTNAQTPTRPHKTHTQNNAQTPTQKNYEKINYEERNQQQELEFVEELLDVDDDEDDDEREITRKLMARFTRLERKFKEN